MDDINSRVRSAIADALQLDSSLEDLGDDDDLSERLGVDSVAFLEILMVVEEQFEVSLPDAVTSRQSVGTVRKLAGLVAQAQATG